MNRGRDIFVISVIILQVSVVVLMNHVIRASPDINTIKGWLPFWEVVLLTLAVLSIASIRNIEQNARDKIKSSITKSHMHQIEILLQTLSMEKHEFTRHLQALQALVYLNRNEEAKSYLEGIAEGYWHSDNIEYVGHPSITGLINSKGNLAKSQGIEFAVSITADFTNLPIESWDLCSILGNLLDNAMEAALIDKLHPRIGIEFKFENGYYTIYIHNNGAAISTDQIKKVFQSGYTTKNSVGRGYGLFITKTLVERYNGEIECVSNSRTTFVVKIPNGEVKI